MMLSFLLFLLGTSIGCVIVTRASCWRSVVEKWRLWRRRTEVRGAFDVYDANRNGTIDSGELGAVMQSLGQHPTAAELGAMLAAADLNGDGVIDFDEFYHLMGRDIHEHGTKAAQIRRFAVEDKLINLGTMLSLLAHPVLSSRALQARALTFASHAQSLLAHALLCLIVPTVSLHFARAADTV